MQKKRTCTKPIPFNLSQSRSRGQRNTDIPQEKAPLTHSARLTPVAKVRNLNPSAKTETQSHTATTPGVLRAPANKSQRLQPGSHVEYVALNKNSTDVHPPSQESRCCSHTDLSSRLGSITLGQSKLPEDLGWSQLCKTSLVKVDVHSVNQAPKEKYCFQTVPSTTQSHVSSKGEWHTIRSFLIVNQFNVQIVLGVHCSLFNLFISCLSLIVCACEYRIIIKSSISCTQCPSM